MQTFHTNIYDASRNQRTVGANVIGGWGTYTLSGTLDHSEILLQQNSVDSERGLARVTLSRETSARCSARRCIFQSAPSSLTC